MQPWPRDIKNFPIVLLAIMWQYILAAGLLFDFNAHYATAVYGLFLIFPNYLLPIVLLAFATLALWGFWLDKKVNTVLCLVPQQLLLYLSAGGCLYAIWSGSYASGVHRGSAWILEDQSLEVLLSVFHTWAMILILKHGADR